MGTAIPETICFSFAKEYGTKDVSVNLRSNLRAGAFFMPGFLERRQICVFHWRKAEGMETGGGHEAGYRRHADGHVKNYAERD